MSALKIVLVVLPHPAHPPTCSSPIASAKSSSSLPGPSLLRHVPPAATEAPPGAAAARETAGRGALGPARAAAGVAPFTIHAIAAAAVAARLLLHQYHRLWCWRRDPLQMLRLPWLLGAAGTSGGCARCRLLSQSGRASAAGTAHCCSNSLPPSAAAA
jgi:hypothetical protein